MLLPNSKSAHTRTASNAFCAASRLIKMNEQSAALYSYRRMCLFTRGMLQAFVSQKDFNLRAYIAMC